MSSRISDLSNADTSHVFSTKESTSGVFSAVSSFFGKKNDRSPRYSLEKSLQRTIIEHRRNSGVSESGLFDFSGRSSGLSFMAPSGSGERSVTEALSLNHASGRGGGGREGGGRVSLAINPLDNSTVITHDEKFFLILRPTSSKRVGWDVLVMLLLLYVALIAPYRIGFGVEAEGWILVWENMLDLLFILDICVNFRTGYYEEDEEVMDWSRIGVNYLLGWFWLDLLSSIPFELISASMSGSSTNGAKLLKSGKFVKVFRILRISKAVRFFKGGVWSEKFEDWVHMAASRHTLRMGRLLVATVFVSHINCCLWAAVGQMDVEGERGFQDFGGESWFTHYDETSVFDLHDAGSRYLASMYWSIQTMTTVGYGDILPRNNHERAYSIFSMILGGGYYGFIVATMASLVSNLDANAKSYYEKMDNVTSYMKKRKFPKVLFRKMRRYYKHYYEQRTALNESEILDDLSSQLRTEVALFLIHDVVYHIDLFHDLTPEMLAKLLTVLKPLQAGAGEILSVAGDVGREMYIIISGEMREERPSDNSTKTLLAGEYFGELCVLDINPINLTTVTSTDVCELYSLSRDHIFATFEMMPEVLNHMKDIALERFVLSFQLDAEGDHQDAKLNDLLEEYTNIAVANATKGREHSSSFGKLKRESLRDKKPSLGGAVGDARGLSQSGRIVEEVVGENSPTNRSRPVRTNNNAASGIKAGRERVTRGSYNADLLSEEEEGGSERSAGAISSGVSIAQFETLSGEVKRIGDLENKMDKLLAMMAQNGGGMGGGGGHQGGGHGFGRGAGSMVGGGMNDAAKLRQQALMESHNAHLSSHNVGGEAGSRKSPSKPNTLKRAGSTSDLVNERLQNEITAATNHRRQSRMIGAGDLASLQATQGGGAGGAGGAGSVSPARMKALSETSEDGGMSGAKASHRGSIG